MSLVEIHDPDNLFSLIKDRLKDSLPLRDLTWQSPAYTRVIPALDAQFIVRSNGQDGGISNKTREDDSEHMATLRQKHQIQGYQSEPWLRIFIFRCDDKDAYKSRKRAEVRTWLDRRGSSRKSADSQHGLRNACEWMIIHVVVPNTSAATQPRWTQTSMDEEDALKERSKGNWAGKKSKTIIEKLRNDFNVSDSSIPDRVAQVRLRRDDVPAELLPSNPSIGADHRETPKESSQAWGDLMTKFELLMLRSLDSRVIHYEDEIAEKEVQRFLPGWNFCTFFVLKEGLAQLFEAVGLFEDALRVYDELYMGLQSLVTSEDHALEGISNIPLAPFTSDARDIVNMMMKGNEQEKQSGARLLTAPFDYERKDFRNLIVSNQISLFEFASYIVSRQISLLLILANARRIPNSKAGYVAAARLPRKVAQDVDALHKLYQRSLELIPGLVRLLKQDIHAGMPSIQSDSDGTSTAHSRLITAYTFALVTFVLSQTFSPHLLPGSSQSQSNSVVHTVQSSAECFKAGLFDDSPVRGVNNIVQKVAVLRAELCLLHRNCLQERALYSGFSLVVQDVDVSNETLADWQSKGSNCPNDGPELRYGDVLSDHSESLLYASTSTSEQLRHDWTYISLEAGSLYKLAGHNRRSQALIAQIGLGMLKFNDVASAVTFFNTLVTHTGKVDTFSDTSILRGRMLCLRALNRKDEYIRIGLHVLATLANTRGTIKPSTRKNSFPNQISRPGTELNDGQDLMADLAIASRHLTYDVKVPLRTCFDDIDHDHFITLRDETDGFSIGLHLRQTISDQSLLVHAVKARLTRIGDNQKQEIWLEAGEAKVNATRTTIWLESRVSTEGIFVLDQILAKIDRLQFFYEPFASTKEPSVFELLKDPLSHVTQDSDGPHIHCYPRPQALTIALDMQHHRHLGKADALEITIAAGMNDIHEAVITLKAGTAGLRLHTAEAALLSGKANLLTSTSPGILRIVGLSTHGADTISLPFENEARVESIRVRMQVDYVTDQGHFMYTRTFTVETGVPLDLTVEETFKEHCFYTKFNLQLRTITVPLLILDASLNSTDYIYTRPLLPRSPELALAAGRSIPITFQVRPLSSKTGSNKQEQEHILPLTIKYRLIREEVVGRLVGRFEASLATSLVHSLRHFLVPHLAKKLQYHFSQHASKQHDASQVAIPPYSTFGWRKRLSTLPSLARKEARAWLRDWHAINGTLLPSEPTKASTTADRLLHVDYEIPFPEYLHIVSIRQVSDRHEDDPSGMASGMLGQSLQCELSIRYSCGWHSSSQAKTAKIERSRNLLEQEERRFVYEIFADPKLWIIAGRQRGIFAAFPEHAVTMPLSLIPLQTGVLPLPAVGIRLPRDASDTGTSPAATGDDITLESPGVVAGGIPTIIRSPRTPRIPRSAGLSLAGSQDHAKSKSDCFQVDCVTLGETVTVIEGRSEVCVGLSPMNLDKASENVPASRPELLESLSKISG